MKERERERLALGLRREKVSESGLNLKAHYMIESYLGRMAKQLSMGLLINLGPNQNVLKKWGDFEEYSHS